jgi:hypothetical protein
MEGAPFCDFRFRLAGGGSPDRDDGGEPAPGASVPSTFD